MPRVASEGCEISSLVAPRYPVLFRASAPPPTGPPRLARPASGERAELQLAKPFGAEMLLLCVNRLVGARASSGRARLFENLTCRLSKDHGTVSFLLDEEDELPLFCLEADRFEGRIVREISSGFVRASLGTAEPRGIRLLVLSRTWGGAEIFSSRERIRLDGDL